MSTTHRPDRLVPATLVATLLAVAIPDATAAIKCWTNHEGVRECGNVVPPEFAQQGHETLSKHGITVDTAEAAKTAEELAAEQAAAEAARQARLEAQRQAQSDQVLLDTFASIDDLELTRDGQIAHLDSQIKLVESHIEKLQANLDQLVESAAERERLGEKPGEDLLENIDNVRRQIVDNTSFIDTKRREQDDIRRRFAVDIERFRTLKGLD